MLMIPDDPIIDCMMRTGYPQWIHPDFGEDDEEPDEDTDE